MRLLCNLATFGNLMSGFFALLLVVQGDLVRAAVLLALAAGFDLLDGLIARRGSEDGKRGSEFGGNLDSLADLVSFGVAPAFALYSSTLYSLSAVGSAASLLFLACGAWRLARFPLVRQEDHFVGLPTPPAGLAAALLAVLTPPPLLALPVVALLSLLMVSTLPFPKLRAIRPKKRPTQKRL